MTTPIRIATALTVAGSDSGGGAGIQADLKTFAALGVHGASVITCITAQNPDQIIGMEAVSTRMVRRQLEAVFSGMRPGAVKSGMLFSERIMRVLVDFFVAKTRNVPLIVDPVMISTSGSRLLQKGAMKCLQNELLPRADLVTPNLPEAEVLLGEKIRSLDDLRAAARKIHGRYGCAALVKGGHLPGAREAIDFYFDGAVERKLSGRFLKNLRTHGTGCTYSAAIAAYVSRGLALPDAVSAAKKYMVRSIAGGRDVGGRRWLRHFL